MVIVDIFLFEHTLWHMNIKICVKLLRTRDLWHETPADGVNKKILNSKMWNIGMV